MCSSYDRKGLIRNEKSLSAKILLFELHDKRPRKSRNEVVYVLNKIQNKPDHCSQTIKILNGHIGSF